VLDVAPRICRINFSSTANDHFPFYLSEPYALADTCAPRSTAADACCFPFPRVSRSLSLFVSYEYLFHRLSVKAHLAAGIYRLPFPFFKIKSRLFFQVQLHLKWSHTSRVIGLASKLYKIILESLPDAII
jgi:hypothetical protein